MSRHLSIPPSLSRLGYFAPASVPYKRPTPSGACSDAAPGATLQVMPLTNDISAFGNVCERLLASIATHRPLTEQEVLFIRHYCKELLHKISEPTNRPK